jgi:hypothetical protein
MRIRLGAPCATLTPCACDRVRSLMGRRVGGGARRVRSARERAVEARRLVFMSMPSFGGAGALRGGDHKYQHGHENLRQEAHVPAPTAPTGVKVYVTILM